MNEIRQLHENREDDHQTSWLPLLSEYIDKRLEPAARHHVAAHLNECRECRRELAGLRQTVRALNDLAEVKAPRSFTISPAQARSLRPRPLYRAAQFAAAVAAIFLLITFALEFNGTFTEQQVILTAQAVSPTIEVPPIGTRPPSANCPDTGISCANSGQPSEIITPEPVTPAPAIPVVVTRTNVESVRWLQLVLVALLIIGTTLAFALRPRAPTRLRL